MWPTVGFVAPWVVVSTQKLLNQTVVHWTQKGEINPSDKLLQAHPSIFEPFQPQSKRRDFAEFRADLRSMMSPLGGAVNKNNDFSSYNVTCQQHLTPDRSDHATGDFLHTLLITDLGGGPSPVLKMLKDILVNPRDEVSTLTCPLVAAVKSSEITPGSYPAESVFKKRGKLFASPILRHLREGFDNLALFEQKYGGGLDALRRFVAFGVFSILLHLQNRQADFGGPTALSPMLLYFGERRRNTAYLASHATYNLNRRAIETLYTGRFREWLEPRVGVRPTERKCETFIDELEFGQGNDDKSRVQMRRSFRSYASQLNRLDGLAEALRETVFRDLSGTPLDFYRSLGVRSGFVRPAGNNAVRKYYTLEGVLLEAVVASVLTHVEVTYQKLLDGNPSPS